MDFCDKLTKLIPYTPQAALSVRLDANESCFPPTEAEAAAVLEAVKAVALNRYPDPLAADACRAFAAYYGTDPAYVTAGNGSDELISVIVSSFFQKGDTVLVTAPDFSMYGFYAGLSELRVETLHKPKDFTLSADAVIEAAKRCGAKGVFFSNPCNPTSLLMPLSEVRRIAAALPEALIVNDEAYMDFYGEGLLRETPSMDNIITLKTCSKAFGLAAVRLGFAVAGERITGYLRCAKSPYNVNCLSAAAGAAVMQSPGAMRRRTAAILTQRDKLYGLLCKLFAKDKEAAVLKPAANFVTVITPLAAHIHRALQAAGVSVRGFNGFIRVTAGTDQEHTALMAALEAFYENR